MQEKVVVEICQMNHIFTSKQRNLVNDGRRQLDLSEKLIPNVDDIGLLG